MNRKEKQRKQRMKDFSDLFLDKHLTHSVFTESYRSLRTNINFSFLDKNFRSLLVTSAGAEEGKSVCAANLSYTMAQAGNTTLMIDADLRRPMISSMITSKDTSPGFTGLLANTFSTVVQSGSLEEFGVSDLFWLLSFQKMTGILKLVEGKEKIDIYFLNGNPMDVQWLTRPKEKRLASLLMKNKLLAREEAEEALSRVANTGQKLGYMLITMGLLKEEDLTGLIALHMLEGFRIALQAKTGTFSFEKLPESSFEQSAFNPADLPQLYRQAVLGQEELVYLQKKIHASIIKTPVENLFILPCGPFHPKPAELLASKRLSFLLSYLTRQFDTLIIDSPPILLASDALLVAPKTDGVLLIVKSGLIKREAIKKTVNQLHRAQANLIGVALNQVDFKRADYYKYYETYYKEEE